MQQPQTIKAQELALLQQIQERRQEPGFRQLRELLALRLDQQDLLLRRCQPPEFPAHQARAVVYANLLLEIFGA